MTTATVPWYDTARMHKWTVLAGWVLSLSAAGMCLMSARWKLTYDPWYVMEWGRIGYTIDILPRIGILQVAIIALFLTPRTAVLGAVFLAGYLGGATSAYVRIGEPYTGLFPFSTAVVGWAGLYLREERLRALLPFRRFPVR
jgi:hypothetical protein